MTAQDQDQDERQTLLAKPKQTPLPKFQLLVTILAQFAEPLAGTVIYPFAPQLVRSTGITRGDESKIGYYAGIIESAYFFTECATVYPWGRASDRYGRRPILILGPLGLAITIFGFGLSTNFWLLVVFRALQGTFNGNIGVSKTVISEITDSTNIGKAFSIAPMFWALGFIMGPIIGGVMSNPAINWPNSFGKIPFLQTHPYFLPCAISGSIAAVTFVLLLFGLKETHPAFKDKDSIHSDREREQAIEGSPRPTISKSPLLHLASSPKFRATMYGYGFLTFCDMSLQCLIPLMYSTSIPNGGLGLKPHHIGLVLASYGLFAATLQALIFQPLLNKFGPRKICMAVMVSLMISTLMYPAMSAFAKRAGKVDGRVLGCMVVQVASLLIMFPGYTSMQLLIVEAAGGREYVTSANSIGQMVANFSRATAPVIASSLYAVSVGKDLLGGYLVWVVQLAVLFIALRVTFMLPKTMNAL